MTTDRRTDPALLPTEGTLVGRVLDPRRGPRLVTVREDRLVDVTALGPTMADLVERDDAVDAVSTHDGDASWQVHDVLRATAAHADAARGTRQPSVPSETVLCSPVDLQVLKAAGVTFVRSMVERVIEERVGGDPEAAAATRARIGEQIGASIADVVPGSPAALELLAAMREEGLWSQYLQVGLGEHPEVFTKAPVLASVGHGSDVGVAALSRWSNPEPELALVVDARGVPRGATLGNDVNLRDVEGQSALLLPLAKDNNASASLGPFVRLFDDTFSLDDAAQTTITMRIEGNDGFTLEIEAPQAQISRSLASLVAHTIGDRHAYPDGLVLYCGTPFAPTEDRDGEGSGFTHHDGDVVSISSPALGALVNTVTTSERAPRWDVGIRAFHAALRESGALA